MLPYLLQLLGYSSIIDVLPYMLFVAGDVERQMNRREQRSRAISGWPPKPTERCRPALAVASSPVPEATADREPAVRVARTVKVG
jgi:hypothetical protein